MLSIIVAILLALGCPVPPNLLDHTNSSIVTTMGDDGDTGGDNGHVPPGTPPPTNTGH